MQATISPICETETAQQTKPNRGCYQKQIISNFFFLDKLCLLLLQRNPTLAQNIIKNHLLHNSERCYVVWKSGTNSIVAFYTDSMWAHHATFMGEGRLCDELKERLVCIVPGGEFLSHSSWRVWWCYVTRFSDRAPPNPAPPPQAQSFKNYN